jgi:hypothetical protein
MEQEVAAVDAGQIIIRVVAATRQVVVAVEDRIIMVVLAAELLVEVGIPGEATTVAEEEEPAKVSNASNVAVHIMLTSAPPTDEDQQYFIDTLHNLSNTIA